MRLWRNQLPWHDKLLWAPLAPASAIYGAAMALRGGYWKLAARRAAVFTVAVGNLTVGGNGKTPFSLFLASGLIERGLKTAIVSRGYGAVRQSGDALVVADGGSILLGPDEAGDEPVMMAKSFHGPIAIARRRIDAINLLLDRGPLDAVVLDDAFQHIRLKRDLDLLLVNAQRGLGNGWTLPAGPMREGFGALARANGVVLMITEAGRAAAGVSKITAASGERLLPAMLSPRAWVRPEGDSWSTIPLDTLRGKRAVAVAGLANGRQFFTMLRELGIEVTSEIEFPDHHRYSGSDSERIGASTRAGEIIVTTEKDLVKLERFPKLRDSLYALRLTILMDEADQARLFTMIDRSRALRRPSSPA
ncbi:MAG: tetraacyldisaccharide 4'-kinase [Candidatus Binataceae bacterium]|nr:tetraacyldisaccharide 4'-kinase [Candidatus Binataceae bacterium]